MTTVGVQRITIKNLNTKILNSLIVGVIIAKSPSRIFDHKKSGNKRGVWNFTLRDSPIDYINVTCWGSAEYAVSLDQTFSVGYVVDVTNAKIEIRHIDDTGEQYRPAVTSPFTLVLNEKHSSIGVHEGNYSAFLPLMHYPTKPVVGCLTLADIQNNRMSIKGDLVDLLVIVKIVRSVRCITIKKDDRKAQIRDVVVMDHTNPGLTISLWEKDYIDKSDQWQPRETVLFLADMRVKWSTYHQAMMVLFNSRSVLIENPNIPAAEQLRQFTRTVPFHVNTITEHMALQIPDPHIIQNPMTCQHVLDKACIKISEVTSKDNMHFTALVYAFVFQLDLDGFTKLTKTRCGRCSTLLDEKNPRCVSLECPAGFCEDTVAPVTSFDIRIKLSDHTGSLEKLRLMGPYAEKSLGINTEQFLTMTDDEKCKLKWNFLLERCTVRILVKKTYDHDPHILVLSMARSNHLEVVERLPFY